MIECRTLEGVSLAQLADTFNRAFSGYFVPIQMTEASLRDKMQAEQTNLTFSAGAFYDSQLVGILLQGIGYYHGNYCAYNGGTGVFSEFRGQGITQQMYAFLEPRLKKEGITKNLLEVITDNEAAIRAYQKAGFTITRTLDCFRGMVKDLSREAPKTLRLVVDPIEFPWSSVERFGNFLPSWPYTLSAAQRSFPHLTSVVGFEGHDCVAFGLINTDTGRVYQFGVDPGHRKSGIGYQVFHRMSQLSSRGLSILNIDRADQETIDFLMNVGLEKYISQYEMEREL